MVHSENTCLWWITYSNHVLQTTRLESPLGAPSGARSPSIPNLATRRRLGIQLHAPVFPLEEILGTHWTENWKSGETYVSLFRDRSLLVQLEVSLLHSATDNYCSEQNKGLFVVIGVSVNPLSQKPIGRSLPPVQLTPLQSFKVTFKIILPTSPYGPFGSHVA